MKNLYSVYDKVVKTYMNPIVAVNDGEAIRLFTTWVNEDKNSQLHLYPEQFAMYKLGTLDENSGNLETESKELITGNSVKNEPQQYTLEEIYKLIDSK